MKLLSKKSINVQIASQKKAQIDEGVMIAKKIDALRQTLSSLEQQKDNFIVQMNDEAKKLTQTLTIKIEGLKHEIVVLEEKKKELLKPLDEAWTSVNKKISEVVVLTEELNKNIFNIKEKEKKVDEKNKDIKCILSRIKVRERELIKVYEKAEENTKETTTIKDSIIAEKERLDKYIEEKNREFISRDSALACRERELTMAEDRINREKEDIINKTIVLRDREQTLEREFKRLQK